MEGLNALDESRFTEFLSHSIDFIRTGDSLEAESRYVSFAKSLGGSAQSKSIRSAVSALTTLLNDALKASLAPNAVYQEFVKAGLDEEKAKLAQCVWSQRVQELAESRIGNIVRMNSIEDMNWRFGVTVATSEDTRQAGKTFLQLEIKFRNAHNESEKVLLELTLEQFYSFLKEMHQAQAVMNSLNAQNSN